MAVAKSKLKKVSNGTEEISSKNKVVKQEKKKNRVAEKKAIEKNQYDDYSVNVKLIANKNATKKLEADDSKIQQIKLKPKNNTNKTVLDTYELLMLEVKEKVVINDNANLYRLGPINDIKLPTFKSCQYLEVKTKWKNQLYSRNFSISCSPQESKEKNYYEILVQYEENSIVSKKIYNEWTVGSKVITSKPSGNFYFWKKFDKKNIASVINGVGAAPILSLAKTIVEGNEDINLTIFHYGKRRKDLLLNKNFKELSNQCKNIRLVNVLTHENYPGAEFGTIDEKIIKKYCDLKETTIYVCGAKRVCNSIINSLK